MSERSSQGSSAADAVDEPRHDRGDVGGVVLTAVLLAALVASYVVPQLHSVGDVVRQWLAVTALFSTGGVLLRWSWRVVGPFLQDWAWEWVSSARTARLTESGDGSAGESDQFSNSQP